MSRKVRYLRYPKLTELCREFNAQMVGHEPYSFELLTLKEKRAMGMWAFADPTNRRIHYWHDAKRTAEELAWLFGHEIGHLTGTPHQDDLAEEDRANEYAEVAIEVIKQLRRIGKQKV